MISSIASQSEHSASPVNPSSRHAGESAAELATASPLQRCAQASSSAAASSGSTQAGRRRAMLCGRPASACRTRLTQDRCGWGQGDGRSVMRTRAAASGRRKRCEHARSHVRHADATCLLRLVRGAELAIRQQLVCRLSDSASQMLAGKMHAARCCALCPVEPRSSQPQHTQAMQHARPRHRRELSKRTAHRVGGRTWRPKLRARALSHSAAAARACGCCVRVRRQRRAVARAVSVAAAAERAGAGLAQTMKYVVVTGGAHAAARGRRALRAARPGSQPRRASRVRPVRRGRGAPAAPRGAGL
jgi:hypothetical protein